MEEIPPRVAALALNAPTANMAPSNATTRLRFFEIFILFPLKTHHSTLFNSGVSVVIAILVLAWIVYSVSGWIAEGGRK